MATRKKSLSDILEQFNRISRAGNERWQNADQAERERLEARHRRVVSAYHKYTSNIAKQRGYKKVANAPASGNIDKDIADVERINARKYSRSTYMGLSEG